MAIRIKPLDWKITEFNEVFQRKNLKLLQPQTWRAKTPIKTYTVYVSVGGAIFYRWSDMNKNINGLTGYDPDPGFTLTSPPRIKCDTLDEGKRKCEENWIPIAEAIIKEFFTE